MLPVFWEPFRGGLQQVFTHSFVIFRERRVGEYFKVLVDIVIYVLTDCPQFVGFGIPCATCHETVTGLYVQVISGSGRLLAIRWIDINADMGLVRIQNIELP